MNLHVITPSDLKKFQIEHYSEMLEKPTSETHKKFLKQQLKQLHNERIFNTDDHSCDSCYNHNNSNVFEKRRIGRYNY
jgi:hypothetical protein